jgi:hypothetical protein
MRGLITIQYGLTKILFITPQKKKVEHLTFGVLILMVAIKNK